MSKILAVANIKGGVGKTTTVVNLASALAEKKFRVLAIDLDPQASLTLSLGFKPDKVSVTIRQMLEGRTNVLWPIYQTNEDWDLIPGNIELRVLEHELETSPHRIPKVAAGLLPLRESYDYVLLDCPATTGPLIGAALAAADQVVIPLTPDYLAFQVSRTLFRIIHTIQQKVNPRLRVAGIFLTMYDTRTRYARDFMTTIRDSYQDVPFFSAVVRQSVTVREAPAMGQSVLRYAPDSQAAKAYRVIADELVHGIAGPARNADPILRPADKSAVPIVILPETVTPRAIPPQISVMNTPPLSVPAPSLPAFLATRQVNETVAPVAAAQLDTAHVAPARLPAAVDQVSTKSAEVAVVPTRPAAAPRPEPDELVLSPAQAIAACLSGRDYESNHYLAERELNGHVERLLFTAAQSNLDDLFRVAEDLRENSCNAQAAQIYRHIIRIDGSSGPAWLGLARVTTDPLERFEHCQKAHQVYPTRETRSELGLARLRLQEEAYRRLEENNNNSDPERIKQIHRLFRQAAEIDPADDRAWVGCARTTDNLVDKIYFLKQALKINPDNKEAQQLGKIIGAFAGAEPRERWPKNLHAKQRIWVGVALILLFAIIFIVPQFLYKR